MPKKAADSNDNHGSARADKPGDEPIWQRVTRELADDLAADAPARERAGKSPFDEVSRLREAGLLTLLTPHGSGEHGSDWRTACAAVREIAAADSSIGELLARHYALSWSTRFFGPGGSTTGQEPAAAAEHWLLGGSADLPQPGKGPGLTLTPADGAYVLNGRKSFAAGVTVADRLILGASCAQTGELLLVLVDPGQPGVLVDPVNERLGQRLTGAGSVRFHDVPVSTDYVIGSLPHDEHTVPPFTALAPLALRLLLTHVGLGIAEGTLAEARDISRLTPSARAATATGGDPYPSRPGDDPYLLLAYGELATAAHTAAAVVDHATEALAGALLAGRELGINEHADVAALVAAAAETVTNRTTMDITTRILELTADAGPIDQGAGLDRFWRNARVLTAQTSPAHRLRDIGEYFLNGAHLRLAPRA